MHSFRNDYSEGCHPAVLERIGAASLEQNVGYTEDAHCDHARELIRTVMLEAPAPDDGAQVAERVRNAHIEFVAGGTAANLLVISSALRPFEAVIAAKDGHINVHETGAIEATGHKVLATDDPDGLLSVAGVDAIMAAHDYGENYHMAIPRMLYLSFATESGMTHTAEQLRALRTYADEHGLFIYIDGARLAAGLTSEGDHAALEDILAVSDAFTFGGTKNGALYGEAVVILNPELAANFKACMKQRGALMAKGASLGIQFEALFSVSGKEAEVAEAVGDEPLYFSLARHANAMAKGVREALARCGYTDFASDSQTNQQFIQVDDETAAWMIDRFGCERFGKPDKDHTIVRFVCSWATRPEHIEEFERSL